MDNNLPNGANQDPTGNAPDNQGDAGNTGNNDNKPVKLELTQEQLNERLENARKKASNDAISDFLKELNVENPDSLKAILEEKNKSKSELELLKEEMNKLSNQINEEKKAATIANQKNTLLSKGIKAENIDDVLTLTLAKVSDSVDFGKAVEDVLAKYPHFKGEVPIGKVGEPTGKQEPNSGTSELHKQIEKIFKLN